MANPQLNGALLADHLGMSRMHLHRHIKRYFGCSAGELITRKRLRTARLLLCTTELPVREVAGRVGFADAAYFARVFKRQYGFTPREARTMEEE